MFYPPYLYPTSTSRALHIAAPRAQWGAHQHPIPSQQPSFTSFLTSGFTLSPENVLPPDVQIFCLGFFLSFGSHTNRAEGLFLVMVALLTSGGVQGIIWGTRDPTWVSYMQDQCLASVLMLQPNPQPSLDLLFTVRCAPWVTKNTVPRGETFFLGTESRGIDSSNRSSYLKQGILWVRPGSSSHCGHFSLPPHAWGLVQKTLCLSHTGILGWV